MDTKAPPRMLCTIIGDAMTQNISPVPHTNDGCPMVSFVNLIAGKWAIPILYRLMVLNRPVRFSELLRAVEPITQKELTRQLRQFETRKLVTRRVFAEVPPRVEYQITDLGKSLRPTLDALAAWMTANAAAIQ